VSHHWRFCPHNPVDTDRVYYDPLITIDQCRVCGLNTVTARRWVEALHTPGWLVHGYQKFVIRFILGEQVEWHRAEDF